MHVLGTVGFKFEHLNKGNENGGVTMRRKKITEMGGKGETSLRRKFPDSSQLHG